MPIKTTTSVPETRDDFRCSLCRQRDAFHCEHDTPYRDQYLGTYDPYMTREYDVHSPRSGTNVRPSKGSTNSGPGHTGGQTNSNVGVKQQQPSKGNPGAKSSQQPIQVDAGAKSSQQQIKPNPGAKSHQKQTGAHADGKQQHGKTLDHLVITDKNGVPPAKPSEHDKKAKSCVIL